MNVVIYARFSSHTQTEQSIEGQLKVCYEYAKAHQYTVIGEYIDRAQSGTTDNRTDFQRMIQDSEKHTFQGILVYQLDRFARNRYDSAINKAKLKKNGVRVLSARENITEDASGILIEGVLESMAEYYSVELSQKINRGMQINASKCLSNGGKPGLGYKVDKDRRYYVDEEEAKIVREIFQRYAYGERAADIIRDLNDRRITTSLGREFNKNSLHRLLRNRRYIGFYRYKGIETPNGMPRIVEDDLFFRVQDMLDRNSAAPGMGKAKDDYLLTTKLFCGHCGEPMTGYSGTGKLGKSYHYYCCNGVKLKRCDKKIGMPTVFWTVLFGQSETVGILLLFSCFTLVGFVVFLLRLIWRLVSKPLMGSVIIVKIDILCNGNLEFCLGFIEMLAKILLFDGCKEGLDHSIIMWTSRCREGLRDPIFPQLLTEIEGSILSALVAVKKQTFRT